MILASLVNFKKSSAIFAKTGLPARNSDGKPMHPEGFLRHIAFGIEIDVERLAGRNGIQKLDTADFDDAMPVGRIEPGRLRVEDDFPHRALKACFSRRRAPARSRAPAASRSPNPPPVSMMKCARARFSASPICRANMTARRSSVMPGRWLTRSFCTVSGAVTRTTASTSWSRPVSNSKGISRTTMCSPFVAAFGQEGMAAFGDERMHDRFEPRERRRIGEHFARRGGRDRQRRSRVVPGNAASIASAASPP